MTRQLSAHATTILAAAIVLGGAPLAEAQPASVPEIAASESHRTGGQQLLMLTPRGGFGRYNESTVEQDNTIWSAGLGVTWQPDTIQRISGELGLSGYERRYLQVGVGPAGGLPTVFQDEIQVGGAVSYGYNLLSEFGLGGWVYLGWRHLHFNNDRFATNLTGALIGGSIEFPLTDDFSVLTQANYTFNLVSLTDPVDRTGESFTGDPLGSFRFGAGFQFAVAERVSVGVLYAGEHLPYDRTDLLFHQAVLEIGIPIRF